LINIEQSAFVVYPTLFVTVQKGASMGGHPVPEIACRICNNPVDLTVDLSADENGKAVHEHCYVLRITKEAFMSPYFGWVPRCAICRNSVNLRVSKTDEYGRAVHENCYVWRLLSKKPPLQRRHPPECRPPTPVML